ncbi:RidA family protein [Marinobacter piscensis]|uniref:RidA family protein n=1 Tax=Marinobacter piscensis TaxID=1562308 RepID=UPI0011A67D85|nr:RidA family protein [Marinobacter piscensis]
MRKRVSQIVIATVLGGAAAAANAETRSGDQELIRHALPDSDFPISLAVEVPANKSVVHLSGQVPVVINDDAEPDTQAAYGTMEEQATSALQAIEKTLESLDLTMGDVYRMQVFLVAEDGKVDFSGFMNGYTKFFGTEEQPNLPVRSAVEVAALANPGWLIEIEVSAVRNE